MSFNKITIIGNLGRDPELRYTPQGDAVCSFTMATNEKRKGEDLTTWFKITLWRQGINERFKCRYGDAKTAEISGGLEQQALELKDRQPVALANPIRQRVHGRFRWQAHAAGCIQHHHDPAWPRP